MQSWLLSRFGASRNPHAARSAEARARGESLQEYLLDVLDREAHDIDNRRLLADWAVDPLLADVRPADFVELMHSER